MRETRKFWFCIAIASKYGSVLTYKVYENNKLSVVLSLSADVAVNIIAKLALIIPLFGFEPERD